MGNKTRTTTYELLDNILGDNNGQWNGTHGATEKVEDAKGNWITSKEQFDKLYQSVGDIEKSLRS